MKRRATLQAGLAAGIAAATFPSAAASERPQDTRLMGVWRSDRDRTVDMWRFKPGLDVSTRERIADMFGKLTLRFTDQRMFSEYEGRVTAATRYRIVASELLSVVIAYRGEHQAVVEQLLTTASTSASMRASATTSSSSAGSSPREGLQARPELE